MKVGEALRGGTTALAGATDTPGSDARVLLADTLGCTPTWLLAHDLEPLSEGQSAAYASRLEAVAAGEPLPYVLGWWEFFGRRFAVSPDVLIPRPETELIVEQALEVLRRAHRPFRGLDVGTGSGCIAITLAAEVGCPVVATDIRWEALAVARRNASEHGVGPLILPVQSDLLGCFAGGWSLVCANLPYIASNRMDDIQPSRREPRVALDGGAEGTLLLARLIRSLGAVLAPGGCALLELDEGQGASLALLARQVMPAAEVDLLRDAAGWERLLRVRAPG